MSKFAMLCIAGTICYIILLEGIYRSIEYRQCIYDALNKKPLTMECKELFEERKR